MGTLPTTSLQASQLLKEDGSINRLSYKTLSSADAIPKPYKPLTGRQLLQFSMLIMSVYLFTGIVVYKFIAGMTVLDAVYFSVVTLTTVGYGDLRAHNSATKLFACLYIMVGVAMIGALLTKLVEIILDREEEALLDIIKKRRPQHGRRGYDDGETFGGGWCRKISRSFESFTILNPFHLKLGAGILSFMTLIFIGAAIFKFSMGLSFVDAFYLTIVSASTVGYGDFFPQTTATKIFAIFYLPVSTLLLAKVISDYTEMTIEANKMRNQRRTLLRTFTKSEFAQMDENNDGKIDKCEFLVRQLVLQEKVTQAEIDQVWEQFERLDTNYSGFLEFEDVSAERDINNDGLIDLHDIHTVRIRDRMDRKKEQAAGSKSGGVEIT